MSADKKVTIFGSSEVDNDSDDYKNAKRTAYLLAKEGFTIVNGGGPGVMRAASEGAKQAGGKTLGATFSSKGMTKFEGRDQNNILDKEYKFDNYWDRIHKLLDLGDVYIFFNGGTGTIGEFAMAWGLARLFYGNYKPLILFGEWWHDLTEAFGRNMFIREEELKVYKIVTTPERAVEEIQEFLG